MTQIYLVYCIILSKSISKDFVKKKKAEHVFLSIFLSLKKLLPEQLALLKKVNHIFAEVVKDELQCIYVSLK